MFTRTDICAIEGNSGNDQEQPATVYVLTRCPFSPSKLNIHTTRTYKFDVEFTTQAIINRRMFAYVNIGVPGGVNMDGLRNACALSVAMMLMWVSTYCIACPYSLIHE